MSAYSNALAAGASIVALWSLGETSGTTFADSIGGVTMTKGGGVTLGQAALPFADTGHSALFDGSSGYAVAASASLLNFEYTQPVTFVASVLPTALGSNGQEFFILNKELNSGQYSGWSFGLINDSGVMRIYFLYVGDLSHQLHVNSSLAVSVGSVHQVRVSYDGSGVGAGVQMWLDGVLDPSPIIASNGLGGVTIQTTAPVCFTSRQGASGFFAGKLEYIALYFNKAPDLSLAVMTQATDFIMGQVVAAGAAGGTVSCVMAGLIATNAVIALSDGGKGGSFSPSSLTFTNANSETPQTAVYTPAQPNGVSVNLFGTASGAVASVQRTPYAALAYKSAIKTALSVADVWPLSEASGTACADLVGGNTLTLHGGVTLAQSGLCANDTSTSALFDGSTGYAIAASSSACANYDWTQGFTVEALIQTNSLTDDQVIFSKQLATGNLTGICVSLKLVSGALYVKMVLQQDGGVFSEGHGQIPVPLNTPVHIVAVWTGGDFNASLFKGRNQFWINGQLDATLLNPNLHSGSILNSAFACIGARNGASGFFHGKIQYVSVINGGDPNGVYSTDAGLGAGNGDINYYNTIAPYHYCLSILGRSAPPDPSSVPNVIISTDIGGDYDDILTCYVLGALHQAGIVKVIGAVSNNNDQWGSGCIKAVFNYFNISVPIGCLDYLATYDIYNQAVANAFVPGDTTNQGSISINAINSPGSGYAAKQVVHFTPGAGGSVLAPNAPQTSICIDTVDGGGAVLTCHIVDNGSYSTYPSGAVPCIGGSGTGLTITANAHNNGGNYNNPTTVYRRLIAANPNVLILSTGKYQDLVNFMNSPANYDGDGLPSGHDLIAQNVQMLIIDGGWGQENHTFFGENNFGNGPYTATQAIAASWPSQIVQCGIELAGLPTASNNQGYYDCGPPAGANPAINPLKLGYDTYAASGSNQLDPAGKRIFYDANAILYILTGGNGPWSCFGGIGGTELLLANDNYQWSPAAPALGAPQWSFLRKRAPDAAIQTYMQTLLDQQPQHKFVKFDGGFSGGLNSAGVGGFQA